MLPDPARYEERYRPTGAVLGLASALLALGLGFLWHTQLIFAALTVLLAIPAVLAIARRPVTFRADHAGIILGPTGRCPAARPCSSAGRTPLPGDLARAAATPAFSFIAPDLCNDGHDSPCVTGAPGGLAQADAFLSQWVPTIMAAPAYRDGGLIVITFDEGSDSAACCGETSGISPSHPNVPLPGKTGPGGGRIGAVLLSPLIRPGTVSTVAYNHYSLLRSIEDIFGLPHLGDAAMPQVRSFGPDVFG